MRKIAVFSVNAQYKIGGAESCIKVMVDHLSSSYDVTVISGSRSVYEGHEKHQYQNIETIQLFHSKHLNYFGNFVNFFLIRRHFRDNDYDLVIGNCSTCLGALISTINKNRKCIYYVHEEFSLNKNPKYNPPKTIIQKIRRITGLFLDWPFFYFHCIQNNKALMRSSAVIANSKFIEKELKKQNRISPFVIYPFTETDVPEAISGSFEEKYLTMVGNAKVKGVETFISLSRLMPEQKFRIIDRTLKSSHQEGNILYCPLFHDIEELYGSTSILLAPSIWNEAFGKVSVEAGARGVVPIVANRGGLPETVCSSDLVVEDYLNASEWKKRIEAILPNIHEWRKKSRLHAKKFNAKIDKANISSLVEKIFDEK